MTKSEAKKRIEKLRDAINYHRYLYHVLDRQEISDEAHDSLKHELAQLEKQFPEFVTSDSPTQRVGGEPLSKFEKVEHRAPMLSMNDVFSMEEIQEWEAYIKRLLPDEKIAYFCEMKMDGFAISILYKSGIILRAATRGNGIVGEDVTQNIKTIEAIPLRLKLHGKAPSESIEKELVKAIQSGELEIRGEIYMDKHTFNEVNKEQRKRGEKEFANPRNLAAGSVRQLDPKLTASRKLKFFAYDIVGDFGQKNHSEEHALFPILGFASDPYAKVCRHIEEIHEFWKEMAKKRESLPYQIDGIVMNVDDNFLFSKLGVAGKSPRGIRAFKFAPKQTTTRVEEIIVHVGRTGALTPIAHLKPVEIGGVTVSRATLHNQDEIERLDVRIGDTVIVGRAGDVIPDVIGVVKELRTWKERKFQMPGLCPVCGQKVQKTEEVILRCVNEKCKARSLEYLHFFVSKRAFDIERLGPKIVDLLVEEGLVSKPQDLFDLKEGDLLPLEHFQEKAAGNIIQAIEKSKTIPLARFIHALGIRHVGEETANDLAQYFGSIEKLENATFDEINKIPNIGNVIAQEIYNWFENQRNRDFIKALILKGIKIKKPDRVGKKLQGKTFVFTGTLRALTRQEAERKVRMLGGDAPDSVSKETDYVVAGENPGFKYDKAKELGVKMISEEEFLKLIP